MERYLQRYRYSIILLKQLVKTDFRLRYNDSLLGYVWSLLRPLLLFAILYMVFAKFLRVGESIPHYPVYLLLGIVLWNYFGEVTSGSVAAIVGRGDLLRKINFPKYVIILAGSFSAFINLLLNFVIIGILMAMTGVSVSWHILWVVPLLLELFTISIALAFLLSALFVRFRDISYIWEVIMQAAFYATPILYPLSSIPDRAAKLLILNPIAQIIQDARYAMVSTESLTIRHMFPGRPWIWFLPIIFTAMLAMITASYFRKRSKYFAEEV
jgi:ABC-2 type transport system permease protein